MILINLIAWGYVGYKVYGALQGDDDAEYNFDKPVITKISDVEKSETETLSLNYADPFLKNGNFSSSKINSSNTTASYTSVKSKEDNQKVKMTSTQSTPTLDIKYVGLIKNSEKGKMTAMLTINGKSFFAKTNDVIEGYSVKQITESSIILSKGKEKLTIEK